MLDRLREIHYSLKTHHKYARYDLIGGLGRLKGQKAVPLLEDMLSENLIPTQAPYLRWALHEITGKEYEGQLSDPWR